MDSFCQVRKRGNWQLKVASAILLEESQCNSLEVQRSEIASLRYFYFAEGKNQEWLEGAPAKRMWAAPSISFETGRLHDVAQEEWRGAGLLKPAPPPHACDANTALPPPSLSVRLVRSNSSCETLTEKLLNGLPKIMLHSMLPWRFLSTHACCIVYVCMMHQCGPRVCFVCLWLLKGARVRLHNSWLRSHQHWARLRAMMIPVQRYCEVSSLDPVDRVFDVG